MNEIAKPSDESALAFCPPLRAKRLGIETLQEAHVYLRKDSPVCRAEGFSAHNRVLLTHNGHTVVATLYNVTGDFIALDEAGVSEGAWEHLGLTEGAVVEVAHAPPVGSLSDVRAKAYGRELSTRALDGIIKDVESGLYSNIHLSAFITACAARPLVFSEMRALTQAMVNIGERISWNKKTIADKHSIGGLPGNRTTPIVVAIAAACGLTIPKTSSRAITSPAGTADTMETLAPVELDLPQIRRVVEREGGCIVWGGAVRLSPTDDILIRVERVLDLDAEGQLVASILSKKIAAGATHLVLDIPVGPTAKVRSSESAHSIARSLVSVAESFGISARAVITDGIQPVGRGIGPALEARDLLAVLQNKPDAPQDLREHAALLAGTILELTGKSEDGKGPALAEETLSSGNAWKKFQGICEAQGGMRIPPRSAHTHTFVAEKTGVLQMIDNRRLARIAKLAGAPEDKAAGVEIHVRIGESVTQSQPLFTVHAEYKGELDYALAYANANLDLMRIAQL